MPRRGFRAGGDEAGALVSPSLPAWAVVLEDVNMDGMPRWFTTEDGADITDEGVYERDGDKRYILHPWHRIRRVEITL